MTVTCPSCGDGVLHKDTGEECDDGNLHSKDGCDISCKVEDWTPPQSTMEYVDLDITNNNYNFVLYFSKPVITDNFSMDVTLPADILAYTLTYTETEERTFNAYNVVLQITTDVTQGTQATFNLAAPIVDEYGLEIDTYVFNFGLAEK